FGTIIILLINSITYGQPNITEYYQHDPDFTASLQTIISEAGLNGNYDIGNDSSETISFAFIDLNADEPVLGGVHARSFIYPASDYKMYVEMKEMKQVKEGTH